MGWSFSSSGSVELSMVSTDVGAKFGCSGSTGCFSIIGHSFSFDFSDASPVFPSTAVFLSHVAYVEFTAQIEPCSSFPEEDRPCVQWAGGKPTRFDERHFRSELTVVGTAPAFVPEPSSLGPGAVALAVCFGVVGARARKRKPTVV